MNALIEAERIINLSNGRIDGTKKYRGTCRVQVLNLVEVSGGCTMMSTLSTLRNVHYCTFYIVLEHYSGFNAPKVYTVSCSIVTSGSCFARLFITYAIKHMFLDVPNVMMTCRYPRYVYYEGIFNLMTNSFTEISYVCVVDQPLKSLCVVTLFPGTNL